MRLRQLSDEKILAEDDTPKLPDSEVEGTLKAIMHDLHKTLLVADTLMRRLEGIIEKS